MSKTKIMKFYKYKQGINPETINIKRGNFSSLFILLEHCNIQEEIKGISIELTGIKFYLKCII